MTQEKTLPVSVLAREAMLRMAGSWELQGQTNQAIDLYLRILAGHPGNREAEEARGRLVALARAFEQTSRFHLALDLYERIELACRG